MKNIALILIFISASTIAFSQKEKTEKIKSLYEAGKYSQCIESAQKITEKDSKNFDAYFYAGFSHFAVYKTTVGKEKMSVLKNSLKNIDDGVKCDKEKSYSNSEVLKEIHDTLRVIASKLYLKDKEKSKSYFNYLVKIYKDTTDEYIEFYHPEKIRPDKAIVSQMEKGLLNQTDEKGLKQGHWQKVYDNGNIAYDVYFKDDLPTGTFKRYHRNGNVESILNYKENSNRAGAEIFDENGLISAKGVYQGKEKDSIWTYFNPEKKVIRTEEYRNGKLNGKSTIFYKDGAVYDEKNYVDGLEQGSWKEYFKNGNLMLQANLTNGKRSGLYTKYFSSGNIEMKGNYIEDLPEGTWEYYTEKGKKQILIFKNGQVENQKELDKKEAELYKKTMLEGMRIIDPQNFMNNPDEYNQQIQNK
jgi:antitoxin component YwqK of YwqJK toxin-antitoxin module